MEEEGVQRSTVHWLHVYAVVMGRDRQIAEGKRVKPPSKSELRKLRESQLEELKKAKQSREQRLREREEQERLKQEEITLRYASRSCGWVQGCGIMCHVHSEMALLGDWESKEAEFHREQANNKSIIRLREGRHRSIDMLAKNLILMTVCLMLALCKSVFE